MNDEINAAGHRSLYEVTGDIKDINTMLVPRAALATPVQAGEYPELPAAIDSYYDDIDKEVVTTYSASQMRAYADATCEARAAAASKPRGKEARERRRWLSDSFNRGTQTLDEATVSARAMAAPLAITSAPKRIWLDLGFNPYEDDVHFSRLHDLTWSQNNATGDGIEYVRADRAIEQAHGIKATNPESNK